MDVVVVDAESSVAVEVVVDEADGVRSSFTLAPLVDRVCAGFCSQRTTVVHSLPSPSFSYGAR